MAKQKQDDQPEHTYSSYVRTQDVTQKTCRRRWTRGKSGERWSRISVLATRHDDDDDECQILLKHILNIYLYIHFLGCICKWARGHFFGTQLYSFKYCYATITIQHQNFFAHIWIDIHDMQEISLLLILFLNYLKLICLHTSIAVVSEQLNGFIYCYLKLLILFNINHLFAHSKVFTNIAI